MSAWEQELKDLVVKEAAIKLASQGASYRKRIWEILRLQKEVEPWVCLR